MKDEKCKACKEKEKYMGISRKIFNIEKGLSNIDVVRQKLYGARILSDQLGCHAHENCTCKPQTNQPKGG